MRDRKSRGQAMYKKIGTLSAHVRKADRPALRPRAPKLLPLEPWRIPSLMASPPPASHVGCVDWYVCEQPGDRKASTVADAADPDAD
jgi:hypothetical protein